MRKFFTPSRRKGISYFLIFLMLIQLDSCQYLTVKNVEANKLPHLARMGEMHNRFIVHSGTGMYDLTGISVDESKVSGLLTYPTHNVYYQEGRKKIINGSEEDIFHEVHIYLQNNYEDLTLGRVDIPIPSIEKISVINEDGGRELFTIVGGLVATFVIIGVIALLTKSSCPFVYVNDGTSFVFAGEIYGGAIGSNLQREDYLPLPSIKAKDGLYRIRISNELKERQYTDLARLLVVEHPIGTKVLLDQKGKAHLLAQELLPLSAKSYNGSNLSSSLGKKDDEVFFFNDEEFSQNGVYLNFKRPKGLNQGNLVLKAQNTLWGDYVIGTFFSKFGNRFDSWMEKQSKIPISERQQQQKDIDVPLSVYLKQHGEWKLIDYLNPIGPLAYRDFVMPIDFSEVDAENIELKIETGFMFWQMDYAALDFTPDANLKISHVNPLSALGSGNKNWTQALQQIDGKYMEQERAGLLTEITYPVVQPGRGMTQTFFLHTSGYYELIREFEGAPNIWELNQFKKPGHFSDYSRAEYLRFLGKDELISGL